MRRPFNGPVIISGEYGEARPGSRRGYHTGVDYALNLGSTVVAPENGTIIQNGDGRAASDGRGFFILFKGDSGYMHCLYHLQAMGTVTGSVHEGTAIGVTGNTGASTGPHLHWEMRKAPYDGNSDIAPGSWLFSGAPVYQPPIAQPPAPREFVRIFGDYRSFYRALDGTRFVARLAPNQFGGFLDYLILGRSGSYVKIQTQMYGVGYIYVGPDVAHLTQYYKA